MSAFLVVRYPTTRVAGQDRVYPKVVTPEPLPREAAESAKKRLTEAEERGTDGGRVPYSYDLVEA